MKCPFCKCVLQNGCNVSPPDFTHTKKSSSSESMALTEFLVLSQDVCKIVVNYCQILKRKVWLLSENSDHGCAINMVSAKWEENVFHKAVIYFVNHCFVQLCVVVNDLEYLRSVISRLPTELKWAVLRDQTQNVIGENQFNNTLPLQLEQAQSFLCREIRSALDTLGKKVWHQPSALGHSENVTEQEQSLWWTLLHWPIS